MLYSLAQKALDHSKAKKWAWWVDFNLSYEEVGKRVYQLQKPCWVYSGIKTYAASLSLGEHPVIQLFGDGMLRVAEGYVWDGPSGPTVDTKDSMKGSLFHDALYDLGRAGLLDEKHRKDADDLFYRVLIQEGMYHWRAKLWHDAVRKFAGFAYKPKKKQVHYV